MNWHPSPEEMAELRKQRRKRLNEVREAQLKLKERDNRSIDAVLNQHVPNADRRCVHNLKEYYISKGTFDGFPTYSCSFTFESELQLVESNEELLKELNLQPGLRCSFIDQRGDGPNFFSCQIDPPVVAQRED